MTGPDERKVLRVSRWLAASPERVFAAWTSPEVLARWWAAAPNWESPHAEVDLRPGGTYRLSMRDTDTGAVHTVAGEYTEVTPPERVAYTWTWEGEPAEMRGSEASHVTVDFLAEGDGTVVVLTHRGFADERIRHLHGEGWAACLDNLDRRVFGSG